MKQVANKSAFEILPITNSIDNIEDEINTLVRTGRLSLHKVVSTILDEAATEYPTKNAHISLEISSIGEELRKRGMFSILEKFWLNITEETDLLNKTRTNKLNRGISLANTGVSQIIQTKIKEGIFNLYRALADDAPVLEKLGLTSDPEINTVTIPLYLQFETGLYEKLRQDILIPFSRGRANIPNNTELEAFLSKQYPDKRLFLFQTLSQLFSALRRNKILSNMLSRQDIIRSISDLCLYLEDSLRRKDPSINSLYAGLAFLRFGDFPGGNLSRSLDELASKISIANSSGTADIKSAKVTILLRNYSAHNLETYEHVLFNDDNLIKSYVADIFYTLLLVSSEEKV